MSSYANFFFEKRFEAVELNQPSSYSSKSGCFFEFFFGAEIFRKRQLVQDTQYLPPPENLTAHVTARNCIERSSKPISEAKFPRLSYIAFILSPNY